MSEEIRGGLERLRQDTIEMGKRLTDLQSTTPPDQWADCLANFRPEANTHLWLYPQSAQELIDIVADPGIGAGPNYADPEAVLADPVVLFHVARIAELFAKQDGGLCHKSGKFADLAGNGTPASDVEEGVSEREG